MLDICARHMVSSLAHSASACRREASTHHMTTLVEQLVPEPAYTTKRALAMVGEAPKHIIGTAHVSAERVHLREEPLHLSLRQALKEAAKQSILPPE